MGKQIKTAITPTRAEDYPQWYQEVVKASDMAERSPVRGCMVIKPWGYSLWENIVREMDDMFKETGVKNAYFPLFIPLSFLEKEADIGVAGGDGTGILFKKGKVIKKFPEDKIVEVLLAEIDKFDE